ncbi:XTP/dITP diphosphatase [Ignicoccus hospitalis]|uniref:dITP/XTP pyrophosphatase n=1 Tax=Ignicoccus hospitalis (strain KIN4/I / DSM 18386 / JCM 14125) TaxID=453591 RepID=IXTPA_IGNH4|nr:XTP/dITP diphosphatase [Ignicoccus hospitalis]A8A8W1.1 RecName: Full=dITP/XTP pyrophosphatase; AltName: Full=Non-canonical purine NTP pyrophosphatase; AltName: Full=Non-standard purine NTP pyrophosphatase; AltName: Full=Nucleoside-triphosphate diphosphatase; AltName: Full=Nucleoside-triphosphate pyrophosphatase; Short=NTPase [Ignicoccus hospitalis KIN4/I]ABU81363.1 non-canonical purine NTP pyrophosphatase, rdgB/HAM1 family [Ignicoccus hospitalis KIN4/I]HIH90333.1 XTP/dITP diphosphatase [Desul
MVSKKVYFLTSNPHKAKEVSDVLSQFSIEVVPLKGEKLEIQADSVEEVARFAAEEAKKRFKERPLLLEDSGLFVDALKGFPGPYSNYVYRTLGLEGLLKLMEGVEDRRARFVCAAALVKEDDKIVIEVGEVEGEIAYEPRGDKGFGFDPIFVPLGYEKTFAELGEEVKKRISHRARAFMKIAKHLSGE